jgi:hypothetical protein
MAPAGRASHLECVADNQLGQAAANTSGQNQRRVSMRTKKALLALSTAIVLLGAATAAQAGSRDDDESGGFVVPGSLVGVNPVYHPGIFGNSDAARAYGFVAPSHSQHTTHKHTARPTSK